MEAELEKRLRLLFKEAYQRKVMIALAFLVISLVVTAVGVAWPKSYSSSVTLLVEEKNIIEPRESGGGSRDEATNQVPTVSNLLSSRRLLEPLLREGGWVTDDTTPAELEEHLALFQERVSVSAPAPNLVRVGFRDGDPQRAHDTAAALGDLVIYHLHEARLSQSRAAHAFIDRQVRAYEQALERSRERLAALREENPLAHPGAEEQAAERVVRLRARVDELDQELREARAVESTLLAQLSGESDVTAGQGDDPYAERLTELRDRLRQLLLVYTESYPDVVSLRREIAELEAAASQPGSGTPDDGLSPAARERLIAERVANNPVLRELQQNLYETRARARRLETRLAEQQQRLAEAREREEQARDIRDEVDRLTGDHDLNRELHQEVLRQRENARVAMTLKDAQQPFTLSVSEPAYFPHQPSGPRLLQFAAGGLVAGASVPLSLLFLFLLVDPRVRTGGALPEPCARRLLEVIPHVSTRRERVLDSIKLSISVMIVLLGMGGVVTILALRYLGLL